MSNKNLTQKDFESAVERMAIGGNNTFAACFDNFLNLALSYFCNNMDERQMHLRKYMDKNDNFRQAYLDALLAYGDLADDYHDPVGDVFMDKVSHGQHGQFFTPESISLLMSEVIMENKIHDGMTINDPACGSGRTLLMSLKHLREKHDVEPKLYANDLSLTCAKMTLLNFCVNSVEGEVTCGNTLLLDYENFTFFKLDKVRNLLSGQVLTTYWQYTQANVKEVEKKRQDWWLWIAKHGWIKYHHIPKELKMFSDPASDIQPYIDLKNETDDPLPTEVKVGENNQLMLF